ncbi:uncharacterized protein [Ptychodera flava]|uniref:uncharacterized protein n=1 Tax=Ptychodera flava TaxID=63121 RepID=UPI003969F103
MDKTNKRIIEPVTNESEEAPFKHYILHHAVINPAKATTKVLIVYDALQKFCKVPFGVIPSLFLLSATVDHHLKEYENPRADKVRENIYVDLITVTGISEQAYDLYTETQQIFQDASMNLSDWSSNSQDLLSHIPEYDNQKSWKDNLKWDDKLPGPRLSKM